MKFTLTFFFSLLLTPVFAQRVIGWLGAGPVASKVHGNLHPRIKLDKYDNPMVVWGDDAGKVWFAKWGGETFSQPVSLGPPASMVFTSSWAGPDIGAHGDTVYVVYKEMPEETGRIYIRHSYDGGLNFSAAEEVDTKGAYITRFPTVTTDETGNPFVTYMKSEKDDASHRYVVTRSTDLGESFKKDTMGSVQSGFNVCECSPAAYIASGNAGVLLYRNSFEGLRNIWAGVSNNGGISFNNGQQIDSTNFKPETCPASGPGGVIVGDTMYTVFMSGSRDRQFVYMGKLSLSKPSLSVAPLTGDIANVSTQNFPRIAGIGNAAAAVWTQTSGGNNFVCLSFTDALNVFGFPATYDTVAEGVMLNADVAIGGGYIYVVWEDQVTRSVMFRRGVYYKKKVMSENTSVLINQPAKGQKYFSVVMQNIVSCALIDATGNPIEMDISYPKNKDVCKVMIDDMEPGTYSVKIEDKDGRVYSAKLDIQ